MKYVEFDQSREFDLILMGRVAIDFNPIDYFKTLAESQTYKKYVGGSPANIAVGMARLGKKIGFIARVSDDRFGEYVVDYFKKEGIDTSAIAKAKNGEKLGLTFTEILSPDESSILMYRNMAADLSLEPEDVTEEYIKRGKALLISGTALCQSPSREACLKALQFAKNTNTPVIFDIDYREYNWKSRDEIAIYYSIVARDSAIILGSKEEYELTQSLIKPGLSDEESAALWENAKIVIIKHGKKGSTAYTKDGQSYSIKPFPVKALKSFGGGDGYASAFLYAIMEGYEMHDALELGSASASMLVSSHGCSEDMPSVEAIKDFIKEKKAEYGESVSRA
ncbi:MAG: 5-dehydro-2-deoxygluconokinase [Johnsonella sp.]|nr:5-dehydro-2-deoxygluconokinase [Johnsonella sp.]